jgi:hypothetical protein
MLVLLWHHTMRALQVACGWSTAMTDNVVSSVVLLLHDMRQMPTRRPLEEPDVRVGLEAKVDRVVQLLTAVDNNHGMVLLHGMAGIGKTTLARAVFNRLTATNPSLPCCFLRLDPEMEEGDVVRKQQQLLKDLARMEGATLNETEAGRRELAEQLNIKGRKVVLVVDNVWRTARVARLLRKGTIKALVDNGSMVLLTSREETAASPFLGEAGMLESQLVKAEVKCLSEAQSIELFCRHAYGTSSPPGADRELVAAVVAKCGFLPMAVEVIGRYYSVRPSKCDFFDDLESTMVYAYRKQDSGLLVGEATLFGALRLSWSMLDLEEQEALLDIALMLKGQPWHWVQHHCGRPNLDCLRVLGLVKQQDCAYSEDSAVHKVATVHDTVAFFCSDADAIGRLPQRKAVNTSSELQQVRGPYVAPRWE